MNVQSNEHKKAFQVTLLALTQRDIFQEVYQNLGRLK